MKEWEEKKRTSCPEITEADIDQQIEMLHRLNIPIWETGCYVGMPSMSVLKPLMLLYRHTGEPRYLDYAKEIVNGWRRKGNPAPNLLVNAFSERPVADWYGVAYEWAKAYEFMSCLEGLIEYYRVTGEARILEAMKIDCIDESEVLSPADDLYHVDKNAFSTPFVCGARDLGEALRRIGEGAAMLRTKGEAGTGDVVQAVRHMRRMQSDIRRVVSMREDELYEAAKEFAAPLELVKYVSENGALPVVNFAAGGVATPADAALMMELGADGVFVGSGIFKSGDPVKRASAIVRAVANWRDASLLAELSADLGEAMVGINADEIKTIMEVRGM